LDSFLQKCDRRTLGGSLVVLRVGLGADLLVGEDLLGADQELAKGLDASGVHEGGVGAFLGAFGSVHGDGGDLAGDQSLFQGQGHGLVALAHHDGGLAQFTDLLEEVLGRFLLLGLGIFAPLGQGGGDGLGLFANGLPLRGQFLHGEGLDGFGGGGVGIRHGSFLFLWFALRLGTLPRLSYYQCKPKNEVCKGSQ